MFTIYTFGDPQLLREALLALATVFGLSEWWDSSNAMGLGGNMLAVALIGLVGIALAGITSQQVRLDYLLVALILFGIGFGSKTDVQIEDIQTGASYVVADIPIGIAAVAAAASSAARNLTETMGTALQRPGTTTSLLTDSGFLDPLRTLYALRTISFSEVDALLMKSLLEYYKTCVGRTIATQTGPGLVFDQTIFLRTADPLGYMLDTANVLNWSTVYYSDANPNGQVTSCHAAAGTLLGIVNTMTSAAGEELTGKVRLAMGTKTFDGSFAWTDIDEAASIVSRSIFSGQDFLKAALMRNFVNTGEAWRLAEYGENAAKYATEVTGALEQQRLAAALQGTIWLNMMFPMMTFFQFIFFSLAPFIALIAIASPFTAGKTIGGYFLFGVWSYAWMPVAAVVNHYIQISLGNALEYSDVPAMGTYYTAIVGMDDFYNQLANKLTIGSNALAAVPMIVGSILFLSFQGLTSLGSKLSNASAATRVSSNVSAPTPGVSTPLVQAGGLTQFDVGQRMHALGRATAPTMKERIAVGAFTSAQSNDRGLAAARGFTQQSEMALGGSIAMHTLITRQALATGTVGQSSVANFETKNAESVARALRQVVTEEELGSLNAQEVAQLETRIGLGALGSALGKSNTNQAGNATALSKIMNFLDSDEAAFRAEHSKGLAEAYKHDAGVSGTFSEMAGDLEEKSKAYRDAKRLEDSWSESVQWTTSVGTLFQRDGVDVFKSALASGSPHELMSRLDSAMTGALGAGYKSEFDQKVREEFQRQGNYIGDFHSKFMERLVATHMVLNNEMATNPNALAGAIAFRETIGIAAGATRDRTGINVAGTRAQIDDAQGLGSEVAAGVSGRPGDYGRIGGKADGLRAAGQGPVVLPEGAGEAVQARAAADRGVVGDGDYRDLSAVLAGRAAAQSDYIGGAFDASNNQGGVVGAVQSRMRATEGWKDSVNHLGRVLAGEASVSSALGRLHAEMMESGYVGLHGEKDPRNLHAQFMARGLNEKQALIATYAAVGPRQAGGEDYLGAVVGGVLGISVPNKIGMPLGRLGVAGVGAAAALSAGNVYFDNVADQRNAVSIIRDQFKTEFAVANAGNGGLISAFNASLDAASSLEEIGNVVAEKRYLMSDEQVARVESTLYPDTPALMEFDQKWNYQSP